MFQVLSYLAHLELNRSSQVARNHFYRQQKVKNIFNKFNKLTLYLSSSFFTSFASIRHSGIDLYKLINGSIIMNMIIMSFTCVLVVLDSSTWPLKFFFLTILSIILLNVSNGFYQNSVYGVTAKLPEKYTMAVIFGNNMCGTIVSVVSIFTIAISPNLQIAAFLYFISAVVILAACFITFRQLMANVSNTY